LPQPTRDEPTPLVSRVSVVRIASVSDAQGVAQAPARVAKALTAVGGLLFAVLAVGLAVSGGRLPASNAGIDGAYVGVLFASVGLCALRTACWRRERVAWGLLSGALAAETLGMVYYSVVLVRVKHPAIPSPADIGYLAFYPLAFAGLIGVLRSRQPRVPAALWADGVIAALAVSALSATVVFNTVLAGAHGNTGAVITELAYPLCDLLLMGLLVTALAASAATLDRTGVLLAAGLLVFTFTDSVFLVQTVHGTFVPGGPLDLGWPLALMLFGMAAWQPPRNDARAQGVARQHQCRRRLGAGGVGDTGRRPFRAGESVGARAGRDVHPRGVRTACDCIHGNATGAFSGVRAGADRSGHRPGQPPPAHG
jgi:hypothetical protein